MQALVGRSWCGSVMALEELWGHGSSREDWGLFWGLWPRSPHWPGSLLILSVPQSLVDKHGILGSLSSDSGHGPHSLLEPHPHTPQALSDPEPS